MSRKIAQEYSVLNLNRFNEMCCVLGVKELSCYDPDKKAIERAFRKRALKTHPDKGGDPVEFKKINEAYNKLIGHIFKLEQQAEQNELAESILIEVSKSSLPKWVEKLKRTYGYFKSSECKCIIFEGPYKQFKGVGKNTGPITVVLYEDPQDGIPKIHVRSRKYMAWIAEQALKVHMHVDKGRQIQFDQWRICHVAEFGIEAYKTPPTPAPERKPAAPPTTNNNSDPKAKRKARDSSVPKPKTRRDSEPSPCPGPGFGETTATDKENMEPDDNNNEEEDKDKSEEMEDGSQKQYTRSGKTKIRKRRPPKPKPPPPEYVYNCGHCGEGYNSMLEFDYHKKKCVPDEDFGQYSEYMKENAKAAESAKMEVDENTKEKSDDKNEKTEKPAHKPKMDKPFERPSDINPSIFNFLTGMSSAPVKKSANEAAYTCKGCSGGFNTLKEYSNHKTTCADASPPTSNTTSPITVQEETKTDVKTSPQMAPKQTVINTPLETPQNSPILPQKNVASSPIIAQKNATLSSPMVTPTSSPIITPKQESNSIPKSTVNIAPDKEVKTAHTEDTKVPHFKEVSSTKVAVNERNVADTIPIQSDLDENEIYKAFETNGYHTEETKIKEDEKQNETKVSGSDAPKKKVKKVTNKVTKNTKTQATTAKKVNLEKEIIMDSMNNDEIIKISDAKLKSKAEKEMDVSADMENTNKKTHIQMGSLKDNLPSAATVEEKNISFASSVQAESQKNSEEAPSPNTRLEDPGPQPEQDSSHKMKPGDEEHSILKNKNIQELQNALKPRVSFSDDLPISPIKSKSGRSSKDSPILLRKLVKSDDSPKSSPTILKKFAKQVTSHIKTDSDKESSNSNIPMACNFPDSPKVQKSILKDSGNKVVKLVAAKVEESGLDNAKPQQPILVSAKENPTIHKQAVDVSKSVVKDVNELNNPVISTPELKTKSVSQETTKSHINKSILSDSRPSLDSIMKHGDKDTSSNTTKPVVKFSPKVEKSSGSTHQPKDDIKQKQTETLKSVKSKTVPPIDEKKKSSELELKNSLSTVSTKLLEKSPMTKSSKENGIQNKTETKPVPVVDSKITNKDSLSKKELSKVSNVKEPSIKEPTANLHDKKVLSSSHEPASKTKEPSSLQFEKKPVESSNESTPKISSKIFHKSTEAEKTKEPSSNQFEKKPVESSNESTPKVSSKTFHKSTEAEKPPTSKFQNEHKNRTSDIKQEVTEEKITGHDKQKSNNTNSKFPGLDVEALRLANNILHSYSDEGNLDNDVKTEVKKSQLNMKPLTKHHVQEQHSLDHEAIKVSNNIFSDKTKLTEKELQSNNEKIENKSKQKPTTDTSNDNSLASNNFHQEKVKYTEKVKTNPVENSTEKENKKTEEDPAKTSPVIQQAKQCYVVNKPVTDKPSSPKSDLKPPVSKPSTQINKNKQETPKVSSNDDSNAYFASNVIYSKQDSSKDKKETATPLTASNVIYTRPSLDSECKSSSTKTSNTVTGKPPIQDSSKKEKLNSPTEIDLSTFERRKRHEEDHRQKVPSSLGISRFEYNSDIDVSRTILRNATLSDFSAARSESMNPITHASSFAFQSEPTATPMTQRRFHDRNFNTAPAPYSSKYNVHFSESKETPLSSSYHRTTSASRSETTSPNRYGTSPTSSSYSTAPISRSQTTSPNRFGSNTTSTGYSTASISRSVTTSPSRYGASPPSSSYSSASVNRAKSEGYNKYGLPPDITMKVSSSNSDLMNKIQASKDAYRQNYESAMHYSKETKYNPVAIIPKLPRPGHDYDRILENSERDKYLRRMERERSVMDKVLTDRGHRSTSIHK